MLSSSCCVLRIYSFTFFSLTVHINCMDGHALRGNSVGIGRYRMITSRRSSPIVLWSGYIVLGYHSSGSAERRHGATKGSAILAAKVETQGGVSTDTAWDTDSEHNGVTSTLESGINRVHSLRSTSLSMVKRRVRR